MLQESRRTGEKPHVSQTSQYSISCILPILRGSDSSAVQGNFTFGKAADMQG